MTDLVHDSDMVVDVILRDGTTLRLRAPVDDDVPALVGFFADLSLRSRFLRFHGLGRRGRPVPAHPRRSGLGREGRADRRDGRRRRGADRRDRELRDGFAIRTRPKRRSPSQTTSRRRGSARGSSSSWRCAPSAHGIEAFIAEVLAENRAMLSVFENVGFVPTRTLDGGVVEVRFPIAATAGYQARVDERDHVAVTASLRPFFEPRTVAVVGASARAGSIGGLIFRNILDRRVHRCGLPRESFRRARRRRPCLPLARRDRRSHRPLRRLPPRRARHRRSRGGAEHRDARALRHLGGFRRDGAGGGRAPGAAAHPRPRPRRAARRPELPRDRERRRRPERDVRSPCLPGRDGSASRRSRERSASRCSSALRAGASACRRSSRSATRPTSPPTTCSSGGRTTREPTSSCSTSSRSATRASSPASPGASPARSPCSR